MEPQSSGLNRMVGLVELVHYLIVTIVKHVLYVDRNGVLEVVSNVVNNSFSDRE